MDLGAKVQPTELSASAIMSDDSRFSLPTSSNSNLDSLLNMGDDTPNKKRRQKQESLGTSVRAACTVEGCHESFPDMRRLNQHVAKSHAEDKMSELEDDPKVWFCSHMNYLCDF